MNTSEDLLRQILDATTEQLRWSRAAMTPDVRRSVDLALTTTEHRQIYEVLDGSSSGSEVAKKVGVSDATVSRCARRWRNLGIAYETGGRRSRHLISLEDLGLPVEVSGTESHR